MTDGTDLRDIERRLRRHVEALAGSPRVPGSLQHREAAAYIRRHLEAAGFSSADPMPGESAAGARNVATRPDPDDDRPLLICGAHYDSREETPGADDNASGVAALLELARGIAPHLGGAGLSAGRLQLVSYDLEETGMAGSIAHAEWLRAAGAPVLGMISLEMLGYTNHRPGSQNLPAGLRHLYPDVGNFIGVCGIESARDFLEPVVAALRSVPDLPVESLAAPGRSEMFPDIRRSDHAPFWDRGFPALMITDTSFYRNPNYHRPSDTPQTLDYPFLARVTLGVCAAVSRLLRHGTS
jgi:Zn-dependent M28 family amino/carboxypeptidase